MPGITLTHWLLLPPAILLACTLTLAVTGTVVLAAERNTPYRLGARQLSMILREACARALVVCLHPLDVGDGQPHRRPARSGQTARDVPVLLVPGHRMARTGLLFLETFLVRRGMQWVWTVRLPREDLSLAEHAERLGGQIAALKRASGATQVDVVGFAVGGLVAAWYVRHLAKGDVRRLVTIGTPWQGTRTAVFWRGRVAREILYGSHVLDDLAPPVVPTVCLWSPDDPVVVPSSSAAADGADAVGIEAAGHIEMLLSARVFRAVQEGLTHPRAVRASSGSAS